MTQRHSVVKLCIPVHYKHTKTIEYHWEYIFLWDSNQQQIQDNREKLIHQLHSQWSISEGDQREILLFSSWPRESKLKSKRNWTTKIHMKQWDVTEENPKNTQQLHYGID